MFKIFFTEGGLFRGSKVFPWMLLWILFCVGCRSLPPLAPVNLSDAGWTEREGQAVWRPKKDAPEIAGEIMVAMRDNGRAFVQFTKTPFPFVIARKETNSWQLELPMQKKRYAAPGRPPKRIIWFHLASALTSQPLTKPWSWQEKTDGWRLENKATGEILEGYFQR